MSSTPERRAADIGATGYARSEVTSDDVDTTAGGATLGGHLTDRAGLKLYIPSNESGTLYVSVGGTPTSSAYSYELFAGDTAFEPVGNDVVVKALASAGTITVKVTEYGGKV